MNPLSIQGVRRASELQRPAPLTVPFGIAAVDNATGGLPRGALTEICGPASSGRTSLLFAVLGEMTRRHEICALVDASDSFDPHSASAAGVDLDRLLWVRCGGGAGWSIGAETQTNHGSARMGTDQIRNQNSKFKTGVPRPGPVLARAGVRRHWLRRVEQALKATDLLLQGGGFGLVVVDLAGVPPEVARRVPLASWFRFARTVEHTPTALLAIEVEPHARSCASLVLRTAVSHRHSAVSKTTSSTSDVLPHAQLFRGLSVSVELLRSRVDVAPKKPPRAAEATFETKAG